MDPNNPYEVALKHSVELSQAGKEHEALTVLDEAIGLAVEQKQVRWIITLSNHAAVMSCFIRDSQRMKRYCEQTLRFDSEDPLALYRLADLAHEQGDDETARKYAGRCHKAIVQGKRDLGLLDLVAKQWPEVAGN